MKRVHLISTRMMLLALIACVSSSAQPGQSLSAKSYQEARRVVDAGLQALGGIETLQRIDDVSVKYTAKAFPQGQSANPDASYGVADEEGTRVIDLRDGRSYREQKVSFRGFSGNWGRLVVKNKEAFTQMALYLDARTNLLTKYETIGDDALLGGVPAEREVVCDQNYSEIEVNRRPDDQLFAMPKGVTNGPEILGPVSPTITKLAPDV